jgi:tRNA dimethylallyltransferase
MAKNYVAVIGPTASGKSRFALELALASHGEIVNCDSVQMYKGFDIGSAKPSKEDQGLVPHHLLDCLEPGVDFDAAQFQSLARIAINEILQKGKLPIVVGGSGLYLRALMGDRFHDLPSSSVVKKVLLGRDPLSLYQELQIRDPEKASSLHRNDLYRVRRALEVLYLLGDKKLSQSLEEEDWNPKCTILLLPAKEVLEKNIRDRIQIMMDSGFENEVRWHLDHGLSSQDKPMDTIGYKQMVQFLEKNNSSKDELIEKIRIATRQYAKRQKTWFRQIKPDFIVSKKEEFSQTIETILRVVFSSF